MPFVKIPKSRAVAKTSVFAHRLARNIAPEGYRARREEKRAGHKLSRVLEKVNLRLKDFEINGQELLPSAAAKAATRLIGNFRENRLAKAKSLHISPKQVPFRRLANAKKIIRIAIGDFELAIERVAGEISGLETDEQWLSRVRKTNANSRAVEIALRRTRLLIEILKLEKKDLYAEKELCEGALNEK